ncbi:MAG TPA: FtsX-like permease family protein [archaeon]|nr:FtsX-like permease family protein [archaeon]
MIKLSFSNLFRRKTRTALSVSSIAIGVAAIIVLVSLVDGFTGQFDEVISQFKGIMVIEKGAGDSTLSRLDESYKQKIESIAGVRTAIPEIWVLPDKVDGKAISANSFTPPVIYGLDIQEYFSTNAKGWITEIDKGTSIKSSDTGWVLIGKKVAEDYGKFVGSTIKVNEKTFRVKGILKGDSDAVSTIIAMNLADARDAAGFDAQKVSTFLVILTDSSLDKQVSSLIELKYPDDLQTFTQADLSEQFNSIIGNLRLLAIVIALISSVVAGIGIANTILMSVLERFKEIGALKAVGWANSNIVKMILYEAAFLGIIGGLSGIAIGYGVDMLLASVVGVRYSISPGLLAWSFGFAILLGLIAGIYPAFYASRLSPIDALRS